MPTSISAFPIQQEYPRNLPAASFPNGDDVLLIDGPTNGTRALPATILSQLAASQLPANMPVYDGTQGHTTSSPGLGTITGDFWFAGEFTMVDQGATARGVLSTGSGWGTPNSFGCHTVSGGLKTALWSADGSSANIAPSATGSIPNGFHRYRIGAAGGVPFIEIDGVALTLTLSTTGATPPGWTGAVNLNTVEVGALWGTTGGSQTSGACNVKGYGTGTWSASDITTYASTGALPAWTQTQGKAGSTQTSGVLVVGKQYTVTTYVAGDDFTNVGAASNASGVTFAATGTTPTAWANGSTLTALGTIAGMDPTHDGRGGYWPDVSGAGRHFAMPTSGWTPLRESTRGTPVSTLYLSEPSLWAPVSNVVLMDLTLTAGTAYTAGQVIASIPNLRSAQGIFQVRDLGGSRYYTGGSWSTNGGVTAWFASGVITADLNNWGVQIIPGTNACTLQLVAVSAVTVGQTRNVQLILVHGDIDISAIK